MRNAKVSRKTTPPKTVTTMTLIRDGDASKGSVVIGSLGTEVTTGLVTMGGIFDSPVEWFFSIVARSDKCGKLVTTTNVSRVSPTMEKNHSTVLSKISSMVTKPRPK